MLRARAAPEGGRVARSWPSSQLRGEGDEVGSVDGVRGPGEIADGVVVAVGVGGKQHGRLADEVDSIDELVVVEVAIPQYAVGRPAALRIDLPEAAAVGGDADRASVGGDREVGDAHQRQAGAVSRPVGSAVDRTIEADLGPHVEGLVPGSILTTLIGTFGSAGGP